MRVKYQRVRDSGVSTINKFNTSAVSPHIKKWSLIDWNKIYEYVKKLRQRIFRAEQLGQKRKVRKLQRLMIRSNANLLLKRVTQINKDKKTSNIITIFLLLLEQYK